MKQSENNTETVVRFVRKYSGETMEVMLDGFDSRLPIAYCSWNTQHRYEVDLKKNIIKFDTAKNNDARANFKKWWKLHAEDRVSLINEFYENQRKK